MAKENKEENEEDNQISFDNGNDRDIKENKQKIGQTSICILS